MIKYCPMCGTKFVKNAKFCMNCGLSVAEYEKKLEKLKVSKNETSKKSDQNFKKIQADILVQAGIQALNKGDYRNALNNFIQAIKLENAEAMYYLSVMYNEGLGIPKDSKKRLEWLQKAAKAEQVKAMFELALMYYYAEGVKQNYPEALNLCEKAANQGDLNALSLLGTIYLEGKAVVADRLNKDKGRILLATAANAGHVYSMYLLGIIYHEGDGVEKDPVKGNEWLLMAASNGSKKAALLIKKYNAMNKSKSIDKNDLKRECYDPSQNAYIIQVGNYDLRFKKSIDTEIEINNKFNKKIAESLNQLQEYYKNQSNIDSVVGNIYNYGLNLLNEVAAVGIDFCADAGKYDITSEDLVNEHSKNITTIDDISLILKLKSFDIPSTIWKEKTDIIKAHYQNIVYNAQDEREYRQQRKENRTRVIGGGFGYEGAVKGMIEAGTINMITGAAHSIFNVFGNLATDWAESSNKESLYNDSRVLNTLIFGLAEAANIIKFRVLAIVGYGDRQKDQEKTKSILSNIQKGQLGKDKIEVALINAFISDPFNIDTYRLYLKNFGDEEGLLQNMAIFFGLDKDLNFAKYEILKQRLDAQHLHFQKLPDLIVSGEDDVESYYLKNKPNLREIEDDYKILNREIRGLNFTENDKISTIISTYSTLIKAAKKAESETKDEALMKPFAFLNNDQAKEFKLKDGKTIIGSYAFANCRHLDLVILPDTLQKIEAGAFYNCSALDEIELPKSITEIEKDSFKNCTLLRELIIPENIKTISIDMVSGITGRYVFPTNKIYVWLPNSIKNIEGNPKAIGKNVSFEFDIYNAPHLLSYFKNNNLMDKLNITKAGEISKSLKEAFMYLAVEDGIITDGIFNINELKKKEFLHSVNLLRPRIIGSHAFETAGITKICFNSSIHTYDRPHSLITIYDEAFLNCVDLENLRIPFGTKKIGARAFKGCRSLKYVSIPDSVKLIGENIFDNNANTIVYCSPNSSAAKYCQQNSINMKDEGKLKFQEAKNLSAHASNQKNMKTAYECYLDAMEFGNLDAYYEVAQCRLLGLGTDKSEDMGIHYLKLAAKLGHKQSAIQLYQIYSQGMGEVVNKSKLGAEKWLKFAGESAESIKKIIKKSTEVTTTDGRNKSFDVVSDLAHLSRYINELQAEYGGLKCVYFNDGSDKSKKKINDAIKAYAQNAKNETVIFVFDDTFWGGAEDGFLITNKTFYFHNKEQAPVYIALDNIKEINIDNNESKYKLKINKELIINMIFYINEEKSVNTLLELIRNIKRTVKFN